MGVIRGVLLLFWSVFDYFCVMKTSLNSVPSFLFIRAHLPPPRLLPSPFSSQTSMKDKTGKFVKPKSVPVASDFADPDFCYGLPGRLSPAGNFDPAGFTAGKDKNTVYRYREAELSHGRIAMLSVVGFLVGEKVEGSTFLFDGQITGPAINHLQQVPRIAFWSFTVRGREGGEGGGEARASIFYKLPPKAFPDRDRSSSFPHFLLPLLPPPPPLPLFNPTKYFSFPSPPLLLLPSPSSLSSPLLSSHLFSSPGLYRLLGVPARPLRLEGAQDRRRLVAAQRRVHAW